MTYLKHYYQTYIVNFKPITVHTCIISYHKSLKIQHISLAKIVYQEEIQVSKKMILLNFVIIKMLTKLFYNSTFYIYIVPLMSQLPFHKSKHQYEVLFGPNYHKLFDHVIYLIKIKIIFNFQTVFCQEKYADPSKMMK